MNRLAAIISVIGLVSAAVRADDLKVLEERFAEVTDAVVPAAAAGRIRDAQRPDGSWDGVDYADKSRGIWQPSVGHLAKRVLVLARAYRATQDRTLADAAKRGLDWWVKSALVCPNWWWNEIGAPQDFAMSAILVSPVLSDEDRARVLCAYIDHGVAPKDASYRYRIVKKQTKENIK